MAAYLGIKFKKFCLILPLIFSLTNCTYLIIGGLGALGGYVVSPDTVEGITEHNDQDVYAAAQEIVSIMGQVREGYQASGTITGQVSGAEVTIMIIPLGDQATKLTVKARKLHLPRIQIAQDVFVKIMTHLSEEIIDP